MAQDIFANNRMRKLTHLPHDGSSTPTYIAPTNMTTYTKAQIDTLMASKPPGTRLAAALGVVRVFPSGVLVDEVRIVDAGSVLVAYASVSVSSKYV